jgi:hypothetical protein
LSITELSALARLIEIENLLNEYSGKRYHFLQSYSKYSLVEVCSMGNEKIIIDNLSLPQMYAYLKKHIVCAIMDWKV